MKTSFIIPFVFLFVMGMAYAQQGSSGQTPVVQQQTSIVNINLASAEEIAAALSGIGIQKAKMIVAYREQHGDFIEVEQLLMIKGIGEKTLARNKSFIRL